jgi:hypothetical protein
MAELITKTYPVDRFDRISFRAIGKIQIIQGEEEGLSVTGSPELFDHLKIDISSGQLIIQQHTWYDFLFLPKSGDYVIKVKTLHEAEIQGSADLSSDQISSEQLRLGMSGSGKIIVNTLKADQLNLDISGSGKMEIENLTARELGIRVSGSGKFGLKGETENLSINSSGSTDVTALDLISQQAEIRLSGSGSIQLQALKTLNIHVSGSGNIQYLGEPQVSQSVSGSASIRKITHA